MRARFAQIASASLLLLGSAHAAQTQHSLQGPKLSLRDIVANVDVKLVPGTQGVQVSLDGDQKMIDRMTYAEENGAAVVAMRRDDALVTYGSEADLLHITITIAPGQPLDISNQVGNLVAGDIDAPLTIDASASGNIQIGRVTNASIQISGSSSVTLGDVDGTLSLDTDGSGDLKAGRAGATSISINGSGDADIAAISGGLSLSLQGSGDVRIGTMDGAAQIETSGSGDVQIAGGSANPFAVSTSGSGDIVFGGKASNPQVSTSGSGDVCIAAAEGAIALDGGNVRIDPACHAS